MANFLLQCATNPNYDPIKYSKYIQHYKEIQDTLLVLSKIIIDPNSITGDGKMGFSQDFIDGVGLSKEASMLRSKIDEKASKEKVNWTKFEFKFDPINLSQKIPTCYRLEPIRWLEIHYVANLLLDCAKDSKKNLLDQQDDEFKCYQSELVTERVIDLKTSKFHNDFVMLHEDLSAEAKTLRSMIAIRLLYDCKFTFEDVGKFGVQPNDGIPPKNLNGSTTETIKFVTDILFDCVNNRMIKIDQQSHEFKSFHVALVNGNVIDTQTKRFHKQFVTNDEKLSPEATKLRDMIISKLLERCSFTISDIEKFENPKNSEKKPVTQKTFKDKNTEKEINEFFNKKLLFAVNTPNEEELDKILNKEVGKKYNLIDADLQYTYILSKMINWFKSERNDWLDAKNGEEILMKASQKMDSFRATALSINYREELCAILSFAEVSTECIVDKLKKFLNCSNSEVLEEKHITSSSPKFTAVKVVAALVRISTEFECADSFLLTSSTRLENGGLEKDWIRKALLTEGNPHQLLVVVNDNDVPIQLVGSDKALFSPDEKKSLKGKKVVVICKDKTDLTLHEDNITFEQLSGKAKNHLRSKTISFQGNKTTVQDLINSEYFGKMESTEFLLILKELIEAKTEIKIPAFNANSCSDSKNPVYIWRRLTYIR